MSITRRKLIELGGAVGAWSLSGFACGGIVGPVPIFSAVFEVDHESAIVSVYSPEESGLVVRVSESATGQIVHEEALSIDATTGLGTASVTELRPLTHYSLLVVPSKGLASATSTFRTSPSRDAKADLHCVFSADIDLDPNFASPIFETIAASGADFFLCLGDWPYSDNPPGAWTVDEFRGRHREVRVSERIQQVLRVMPCYAIYDDHEVRNNWDGHFRIEEKERVEAGLQVWDEWFPLRNQTRRYRSIRHGAHAEFFILDTRLYRSANKAQDGPDKTMLGDEQFGWLISGLRQSDATFKFIVTTVPLDFAMVEDSWAAFQFERAELLQIITSEKLATCVFLTGDQHFFSPHHFNSGIKEFQAGPLARGLFESIPTQQPEELVRFNQLNYGEVRIDGGASPSCTLRGRGANGELLYEETIDPGVGEITVESESPRSFEISGAHHFRGTAPASFSYAPVGDYILRWLDTGEKISARVRAGETLQFAQ